jgi:uncharacterized protein (DUF1697 family)
VERYAALLRAINVGGNKRVAMADLRAFVASLGFADVSSLLQSGNLVFRGRAQATASLEQRLEREAVTRLDLATDFLVRTADELAAALAANPFVAEAERDPAHLVVMFLRETPPAGACEALQAGIKGPEVVRCAGRHAYLTYPAGIGESRLTNAVIERALGTRGTARNWNTVVKLEAAARSLG